MMYAIVKGGQIVEAPVSLRSRYNGVTAFHTLSPDQLKEHGWYPCITVNANYDPKTQDRFLAERTFDGETARLVYSVVAIPTERQLEKARAAAYQRVQEGYAQALSAISDRYPQTEREGWPELVSDAKDGLGECIQAYADGLGVSVLEAADRVLSARASYRTAYGQATGRLTMLRDSIDVATTVEELEAIQWSPGALG